MSKSMPLPQRNMDTKAPTNIVYVITLTRNVTESCDICIEAPNLESAERVAYTTAGRFGEKLIDTDIASGWHRDGSGCSSKDCDDYDDDEEIQISHISVMGLRTGK